RGPSREPHVQYQPRKYIDTSGVDTVKIGVNRWDPDPLEAIAEAWEGARERAALSLDQLLKRPGVEADDAVRAKIGKAILANYAGEPKEAYEILGRLRSEVEADKALAGDWLYSIIWYQGVSALRRGETENCVLCRGESSCILPLSPAAVHTNP